MNLFRQGTFVLHSGARSWWKVDCDALADDDLLTLARVYSSVHKFGTVVGVPDGGVRFATALREHVTVGSHVLLIADDVLTTGGSMNEERARWAFAGQDPFSITGVVLFSRGRPPWWVTAIWQFGL